MKLEIAFGAEHPAMKFIDFRFLPSLLRTEREDLNQRNKYCEKCRRKEGMLTALVRKAKLASERKA